MVYALSPGDTFDMGFVHCIHSEEWERSASDPSSSSSRLAKMLKRYFFSFSYWRCIIISNFNCYKNIFVFQGKRLDGIEIIGEIVLATFCLH